MLLVTLSSKSGFSHLPALSAMCHIAAALIKNTNSRHASVLAHNIPMVFFMTIISSWFGLFFSSLSNGCFLASRALFWQAALLGLTAGSAVLMINFADRCGFCSLLIHFSLLSMHVDIPAHARARHGSIGASVWTRLRIDVLVSADSPLHPHASRTSCPHAAWTYREKQSGLRQIQAGGAFKVSKCHSKQFNYTDWPLYLWSNLSMRVKILHTTEYLFWNEMFVWNSFWTQYYWHHF